MDAGIASWGRGGVALLLVGPTFYLIRQSTWSSMPSSFWIGAICV
jgi:hypothetical protein